MQPANDVGKLKRSLKRVNKQHKNVISFLQLKITSVFQISSTSASPVVTLRKKKPTKFSNFTFSILQ